MDRLGRNGVLLLEFEKDGHTDFAWLGLEEVNLAYWGGATLSATFDRQTVLRGPVQACTLPDMAELTAGGADSYDVGRGLISALGPGQYGPCLGDDLAALSLDDPDTPPTGGGYFYLVRGNVADCPANWGYDSEGNERINSDPAACP